MANLPLSDEPVNDSPMTDNDTPKIVALLEGQVADLKDQLDTATTENAQLLELATRLQKQNETPDDSASKAQTTLFSLVVALTCSCRSGVTFASNRHRLPLFTYSHKIGVLRPH